MAVYTVGDNTFEITDDGESIGISFEMKLFVGSKNFHFSVPKQALRDLLKMVDSSSEDK